MHDDKLDSQPLLYDRSISGAGEWSLCIKSLPMCFRVVLFTIFFPHLFPQLHVDQFEAGGEDGQEALGEVLAGAALVSLWLRISSATSKF